VHTPAGLIVALVKVTLTRLLRLALVGTNAYFQISNLATHYVIYWALVAAVHALAYYRAGREGELRASQLEARLADAGCNCSRCNCTALPLQYPQHHLRARCTRIP
jgi:hypothetical protein